MVRGHIAATSLKMLWKNLYSIKCYDKLNMNVFTLSLWEIFWWGLIYFDQFTCHRISFNNNYFYAYADYSTCRGQMQLIMDLHQKLSLREQWRV